MKWKENEKTERKLKEGWKKWKEKKLQIAVSKYLIFMPFPDGVQGKTPTMLNK